MASKIITVIGSLNMDLVTLTPYVPEAGETMTATSFSTGPGGKGANQAVACARLSRPNPTTNPSSTSTITVKMRGAVGSDEFGPVLLSSLTSSHVDTSSILTVPNTSTGVAVIIVETSGENRILLSPGANHSLLPSSYLTPSSLGSPLPSLIVLQLEIPLPTVLQILRTCKQAGVPTLLNPAPAVALPDDIYQCITHLILNETEAALLSNKALSSLSAPEFDWSTITTLFLAKGCKNVVITLGAKGAFYATYTGDSGYVAAEKLAKVVDTTAAGDTFVGAYAVEVVSREGVTGHRVGKGWMEGVVKRACKAAGRTVEKRGAQEAIPWADEVDR